MSKHGWFEVDQTTQRLETCRESIADMLAPTDGPQIRASHLQLEVAPPTTDYIRVMFREVPPAAPEPVSSTKPSAYRFLFVPIGALLIAAVAAIAFLV